MGCQQRGIFACLMLQFWKGVHAVLDYVIDLFFSYFVYDDKIIHRVPMVKDTFLCDGATELAEKIRRRQLSAEQLVRACIDRVNITNTTVRSMVDSRFHDALKEALEIDRILESEPCTEEAITELARSKPFLGVPFTTKESTACRGLSHTFGLVSRKGIKAECDADIVIAMKAAGGILLGVSNLPELNLWCESRNNLFGQTNNPYNTNRTVGGSSGGEAALVAVSASPIGLGTDIGGSIRMPAFYLGVFGHKPTTGTVSMRGTTRRDGTENPTMVAAGPITRKAADLLPILKVLAKPDVLPLLKLDETVDLKELSFYYMEESGDIRTSAVWDELKQALRRAVHHLQEVNGKTADRVHLDGMQHSYSLWRYWMSKEPYQFSDELGNRERTISLWRELPKKLFGYSEFTAAAILKLMDTQILPKVNAKWAETATQHLRDQITQLLGDSGVLLYPSHPFPAPYHYSSLVRPFNISYWAIFNVLHLPATQVPLGLNKDGLPIGIQVIAGPYNDRLCFAVASELERAFGGWQPPFVTSSSVSES